MARQRAIESTDYENSELRGVIDFMHLPTGGVSVQPVTEREFDTSTAEGLAAYEKFMREPVVVVLYGSSNPNDPLVADIRLNGALCPLPRDVPVRIPRAFVEVLAQSQVRTYSQEDVDNPKATEGKRTKRHTGLQFPFRVEHEPNPRGRAWLQRVMHQSA